MTKGKKIEPPKINYILAENHRFNSKEEAWKAVGPIYARLIAQALKSENQNSKKKEKKGKNDPQNQM